MSTDEKSGTGAGATEATPLEGLLQELAALERALVGWDLAGITAHSSAVRTALLRAQSMPADDPPEALRELLERSRRCLRLSHAGANLSASLSRLKALTYEPPAADKCVEREPDPGGGSGRRIPGPPEGTS